MRKCDGQKPGQSRGDVRRNEGRDVCWDRSVQRLKRYNEELDNQK